MEGGAAWLESEPKATSLFLCFRMGLTSREVDEDAFAFPVGLALKVDGARDDVDAAD